MHLLNTVIRNQSRDPHQIGIARRRGDHVLKTRSNAGCGDSHVTQGPHRRAGHVVHDAGLVENFERHARFRAGNRIALFCDLTRFDDRVGQQLARNTGRYGLVFGKFDQV